MKTQKKNGQSLHLQIRNNRWKWMAGATAASVAGVTSAQAGMITINLAGNFISAAGGNHLNADLTGDGQPDVTIANAVFAQSIYRVYSSSRVIGPFSYAKVTLNGVAAHGFFSRYDHDGFAQLGAQYTFAFYPSSGIASVMGTIPIFFKDLHINGGARTAGSLEVTVSDLGSFTEGPRIQLDSLTYTTRENVPDQGSSLALLAIGAGGVLALRRRRVAQGRS